MSVFAGKSGVVLFGVAGVALVAAAAWFEFGRDVPGLVVPQQAVTAPQEATATQDETSTGGATAQQGVPKQPAVQVTPPEDVAQAPQDDTAAPAPQLDPPRSDAAQTTKATAPPKEAQAPAASAPVVPAFDEVRRESDGMTIIAGKGAPGAAISVLLDGQEITTTIADAKGKFATITLITPDGQGHVLSLLHDGLASDDQIILAPIAPVQVAEADVVVAETSSEADEEATLPQQADTAPQVQTITADVAPDGAEEAPPKEAREVARAQDLATDTAKNAATNAVAPEAEPSQTAEATPTEQARTPDPEPEATITVDGQAQTQPTAPAVTNAEPEVTAPQAPAAGVAVTTPTPGVPAQTTQAQPVQTAPTQGAQAEPTEPQQETAPQDVAVLKTTKDGVELLNAPSPEVMDNVALDTISYSDTGDVQLSGRAQPETATVRVYLDNTAIVSLSVDASGRWRGDLPDVDEGIYTLRVDEVTQDGTVSSRVETPFKRESPQVLAAAAEAQQGPIRKITVQKGATLWAIAEQRYGDGLLYVNVFKANQSDIRDPDLIYPGQVFDLPD